MAVKQMYATSARAASRSSIPIFALVLLRATIRKTTAVRARGKKTADKAIFVLDLYRGIVKAVCFSRVCVIFAATLHEAVLNDVPHKARTLELFAPITSNRAHHVALSSTRTAGTHTYEGGSGRG